MSTCTNPRSADFSLPYRRPLACASASYGEYTLFSRKSFNPHLHLNQNEV
jgi:hypothetical protein